MVGRTKDDLHAFWVAPDRTLKSNRWYRNDDKNWRRDNWNVGTVADGGSVAALARELDQLDIFWVGRERDIWTSWWQDETKEWGSRPISEPGVAAHGSNVSAVARKRDLLEVFWVAPDGAILQKPWSAQKDWRVGESIVVTPPQAAMASSSITAVVRNADQLDLFWVSPKGAVKTITWNETDGKNWLEHSVDAITRDGSARPGAQVAAVAHGDGRISSFWIGTNGAIWARSDHAGKGAELLPRGSAAASSGISAVARTDTQLDLFWIDDERVLRTLALRAEPGQALSSRRPPEVVQRDAISAPLGR
jgi:hypothetical protein